MSWLIEGWDLIIALAVFAVAAFVALKLTGGTQNVLAIVLFAAIAVFALPYLPLVLASDLVAGLALLAIAVIGAQWFLGVQSYWSIAALLVFVFVVGSAFMGLV
ncbi:MAG: hypothetical protein AB1626_02125 [Candidatus Micrarchaeota archaeon]